MSTFLCSPSSYEIMKSSTARLAGRPNPAVMTMVLLCTIVISLISSAANAVTIDAATSTGTVLPQRPDVLFLCGSYCQSVTLYATAPTDARELDVYRLSRLMEAPVTTLGGRLLYLANLDLTTSTSAALTLVRARLRAETSNIGTILCMSDLKILPSMPSLLENASLELGFAQTVVVQGSDSSSFSSDSSGNGSSSPTTQVEAYTPSQKYWMIVVDSLVSRGGDRNSADELERVVTSSAASPVSVGSVLVDQARPGVVSTFFVGAYVDAIGYTAGAAVVAACRDILALRAASSTPSSSTPDVCRVGVVLRDSSRVSQLVRAGWNTAIARLPGMYPGATGNVVISCSSVAALTDEVVRLNLPQRMQHRVWSSNASSASLFPNTSTDAPLDVIMTDGPTWAFVVQQEELSNTPHPLRGVERNVTSADNSSWWMGLPAIVTVLTNATTSTTTSSSGYASSSKRMPMIDVSPNATQIFAQLISVLYGSATSSTTDESSSLALRLVTAGSCASANATDVLTAPTTFSSGAPSESVWRAECAVWRLRLGSGDSHFATTTSMSGTTTTSSALGTLAAVVTNMTRFAEARAYFLSTGVEYTQYHYLYRRWRSAATWGVNVSAANISHNPIQANSMLMLPVTPTSLRWTMDSTSSLASLVSRAYPSSSTTTSSAVTVNVSTTPLKTSISTIYPFGLVDTIERFFLNPHVLSSPLLGDTSYIVAQDDDAASEADSYGGTDFSDGFYTRPLAVYRYDLASNSMDRVVVGATQAALNLASANKSGVTKFEFIPFQCVEVNADVQRLFLFGGETLVGGMPVNRLTSTFITGGAQLVFDLEPIVSTYNPTGRLYASLTAASRGTLLMYGGLCYTGVPCNDLWRYDAWSHNWTLLFDPGNPHAPTPAIANATTPPSQGRYQHGATYTVVTVNTGQFVETEWLVIAGGTFTSTFSDAYVFAVNARVWLRIVPPVATSIQSIIPCVAFVGTRLVFTIFASGSTSNISQTSTAANFVVWNILDFNWGTVTVSDWDANPGRCSQVGRYSKELHSPINPTYFLGVTSLVVGSGIVPTPSGQATSQLSGSTATRAPFALQEFTVQDCEALWYSNYYTSSSGLECLQCPTNTYADDPLRISCTTCPAVDDTIPHSWQLAYCYKSELTSANAAFAITVFLQIIAVPILVVFTTAITRSTAWEEDEYVVTELCESIADMMLERVAFLEHVSNPTKLQVALAQCVKNIKVYRRLIPISVLHYADYVAWKTRAKVAAHVQQQQQAAAAAQQRASQQQQQHNKQHKSDHDRLNSTTASSPTSQQLRQQQLLSPSSHVTAAVSPADLSFNMEMSAFQQHGGAAGGPGSVALLSPTMNSAAAPGQRPSSQPPQQRLGNHHQSQYFYHSPSFDSSTTTFGTSMTHSTNIPPHAGGDVYGTHAMSSNMSSSTMSSSTSSTSSEHEMSQYSNAGGDGDGGRSRQHSIAGGGGGGPPPTRHSTARSRVYEQHRPAPLTRFNSMKSGITAARAASDDRRSASAHSDALTADAADKRAKGEGGGGATSAALAPELRLSVSQAVIMSLQSTFKARRVTMLWMRLDGFDAWRETFTYSRQTSQTGSGGDNVHGDPLISQALVASQRQNTEGSISTSVAASGMAAFQKKYTALIDNTIDIIHAYQGVPEAFMGDSILASWNALKPCHDSASQALNAAYYVNSNPTLRSIAQLRATVAVVRGKAKVGIIGMDQSKRPVIMSHIIEECIQMAAHCRYLEVGSLVEWTPEVQLSLVDHYVFRIVGVGKFYRKNDSRRRRKAAQPLSAQYYNSTTPPTDLTPDAAAAAAQRVSSATPATTDAGISTATGGALPRPHVALVAELLGPTSLTQWQYELKGHREYVDAYNTVVRTVFEGRLEDARAIPLPRAMPKWLQHELAHVTQTGVLKTVEVWS